MVVTCPGLKKTQLLTWQLCLSACRLQQGCAGVDGFRGKRRYGWFMMGQSGFFSSGAVFSTTRCVCTSQPNTPWPGGTLFSSDANGKVGDANNGDEVGKQWHEWEERMTLCLSLHGPQLVYGGREAVCKQHWLFSKGKATFVCQ